MRMILSSTMMLCACAVGAFAAPASTRPVPNRCDAQVNAGLLQMVQRAAGQSVQQDNVMVCGTLLRDAVPQHAGHSGHGAHQLLVLQAPTAAGTLQVVVVTNDRLDGRVDGQRGSTVFAYGQGYVDAGEMRAAGTPVSAGVHDTHCATHAGADDGWVVINGRRWPSWSCGQR